MKVKFTYRNRGTFEANCVHENIVELWKDGNGIIHYSRKYVPADGNPISAPIEHEFPANTTSSIEIAKMIHWGCCGWAANAHELYGLIGKVENFLS